MARHANEEVDVDSLHWSIVSCATPYYKLTHEIIGNSTDGELYQKFFIDLNLSTCTISWINTPLCLSMAGPSAFKSGTLEDFVATPRNTAA